MFVSLFCCLFVWLFCLFDFFLIFFFFFWWGGYFFQYFVVPCGKFGSPHLVKAQQPQEQRYPLLSVYAVFPCVQIMVWLPVFGIFNVRTVVDANDCTRELYGHRKRVLTGN